MEHKINNLKWPGIFVLSTTHIARSLLLSPVLDMLSDQTALCFHSTSDPHMGSVITPPPHMAAVSHWSV